MLHETGSVLDLPLKLLASLLSPAGYGARLSILIFHRVLPDPDPLFPDEVDASRFEAQMIKVRRLFNVLPLSEAVQRLKRNALPARAACITFDDGYADNAEVALPILQRQRIPATFFIASGYLGQGCMFNDRVIEIVRQYPEAHLDLSRLGLGVHPIATLEEKRSAISALLSQLKYKPLVERLAQVEAVGTIAGVDKLPRLMMSPGQVRQLHDSGMDIGGHTVNHPILASTDIATARNEVGENRDRLTEITGVPVKLFAYPNGKPHIDYREEHVALVKGMGFDAAVSTAWGVATQGSDLFQLPRFTPWDRSLTRFATRLASNLRRTKPDVVMS